jgi:nucleotide-binding universal stress UspA family protein
MAASRILVGYDGSRNAEDAFALGRTLSAATGAKLVLARIVPWEPLPLSAVPVPELKNRYEEQEQAMLKELQRVADRAGVGAAAGPGSSPAHGLHDLAGELNPDLVILGSSHRGRIGQAVAGNVALRLLNGLDRPLAVAPIGYAGEEGSIRTIGVGFDGSPESHAALHYAGELALATGAAVRAICIAPDYPGLTLNPWGFGGAAGDWLPEVRDRLRGAMESALGGLPSGIERSGEVYAGAPVAILLDEAPSLDLLVLGSRGYGPARRVLLGSVSSRLVRAAPCPVLVVPRTPGRADNGAARAEGAERA